MNSRVSAVLFVLAAGCSGTLDPPSLVNKLRVLAVRAQVQNAPGMPPFSEAYPGDPVTLDALVAGFEGDVDGGVTPDMIDYLWFACTPPPGSTSVRDCAGMAAGLGGFLPTCQDQPGAPACLLGSTATVVYPTAANAPAPSSVYVAVVVATKPAGGAFKCLERLSSGQASGDACVVALKTMTIQAPSVPRNLNPAVATFNANGNDIHSMPSFKLGEKLQLNPLFQEAASEPKPDGTREVLTFSWFATQKDFDHFHSGFSPQPPGENPNNTYTDQSETPGRVHFWLVLRDDRGGVDWTDGAIDFML